MAEKVKGGLEVATGVGDTRAQLVPGADETVLAPDSTSFYGVKWSGVVTLAEQSADPPAPAANKVVLYARDSGGKTQLVARFPTGAVQEVAIEP